MTYSKIVHKYLLKAFYRQTNKKEYKSQILEYNIYYTNVIVIEDVILIAKIPIESTKKKEIVIDMLNTVVMQVYSIINMLLKYN